MDRERWERIQTLFHESADLPKSEQRDFLNAACGDDSELAGQVLAMLEVDAAGGSLLDRSLDQVADEMLGDAIEIPFAKFGPYRVKRVLGEGGMGVVYLAEREDLGSLVAIKVLRDAWISPARRDRFVLEQRTLAQLNHPLIARLYDAQTLPDGTPLFVMEYVEGIPLTEFCARHNCDAENRLKLFRSVCEAVQYAHEHGVIHRDLKPSNILVKTDGQIRLLDFGIAKQLDPAGTPLNDTRTVARLMTPAYAAPEQIRGERASVHGDVYSLGVILYELLAGRLPLDFSRKSAAEEAEMITIQQPARPSSADGRIETPTASWRDLDVLCLTAMHKDPARRYSSVEALIRDVDHYLNRQPLEAQPDSPPYRLGKFLRRHWRGVAAAAAVIGFAALAAVAVSLSVSKKTSSTQRTVAVVPFQNSSSSESDHSVDFLSLALAEEIANTLGDVRSLTVRPFAITRTYAPSNLDRQKVGRDLGVTNIVSGRFMRAGEHLQIVVEAIEVQSGRLLWRDIVNAPVENMIAMRAQLASRTRSGLAPLLGSTELATESASRPKNEEAYRLFLRAEALGSDPGPNRLRIGMLEKSVALDPGYAPAWSDLAGSYMFDSWFANGGEAAVTRAIACGERALALDPDNPEFAGGLALVRTQQHQTAQAYRDAQGLVDRRPDNGGAHYVLSYVLRYAGLNDEAARECDAALLVDAQSRALRACAVVFILRGNYSRAIDFIDLDRGSEWAKALTMDALVRQHREKEALEEGPTSVPQWAGYDMLISYLRREPANRIAALAQNLKAADDPEVNYFSAAHLAYCGQTGAALEMLRRTIEGNYCSYPAIDSDPLFASLRGKSEFTKIRAEAIACQNNFLAQR